MLLSLFSCFPSMPLSMEITEIYARNRKEAERGPLQTYPWKPFPPPWYYVDHGALAFHGTCPLACPMQENLPSLTPSLKEYVISGAYAMRNICFFFRPRHGNISLQATLPAGHAMATHPLRHHGTSVWTCTSPLHENFKSTLQTFAGKGMVPKAPHQGWAGANFLGL